MRHTEDFYNTLYRRLLGLHRMLAAEDVLVSLEGSYKSLLLAVRECLDDLREVVHPRDTAKLERLLREQEALSKEVTATVKWINEKKVKP